MITKTKKWNTKKSFNRLVGFCVYVCVYRYSCIHKNGTAADGEGMYVYRKKIIYRRLIENSLRNLIAWWKPNESMASKLVSYQLISLLVNIRLPSPIYINNNPDPFIIYRCICALYTPKKILFFYNFSYREKKMKF